MPFVRRSKWLLGLCVLGLLVACGARIPPTLASQVSWNVGFAEIRRQPEAYVGRVVALGGIVTSIDAIDRGYRIVVSELPLDGSGRHRPAVNQPPRGTFVVLIHRRELLSDLRPGAEITVVGEVLGKGEAPRPGGTAEVPWLDERYTHVWSPSWWPQLQIDIGGGVSI